MLLAPLMLAQAEPKLVPEVSQREIEIRYSFTGAELLLFGAIIYPGGRAPQEGADIAVVVKGPVEPIVVREGGDVEAGLIEAPAHRENGD